ncbi:SemiSWEET transporter [bacterium]|nr:SemiSWEET transporter [bacterium]
MNSYSVIGLIAAICTTVSFMPQAIKIIRTRQTKDLSLGMYAILTSGIFFWLLYGILVRDVPLIAANLISFVFTFTILVLKIRYK